MNEPETPAVLTEILDRSIEDWKASVPAPRSAYRLQFHRQFTFKDACRLVPYLHALGISHCYASPYLKARPGSTHGYDITNHTMLNPEIGTDADFADWVEALRKHGMSQIADIVPNHMGIVGNENPWWNDVLENGLSSPYSSFFDIAWHASPRPELRAKVLLPILGEAYGKVLEAGQIRLIFAEGAFSLAYFEHRFPVAPQSYGLILKETLPGLQEKLPADAAALLEFQSILTAVTHLPEHGETDRAKVAEGLREKEVIKRRLLTLTSQEPLVQEAVEHTLAAINGKPGAAHSFDLMDKLLDQQPYRLSYWRVAADEINYRRFFDINELAALNMEQPEVFTATHQKIMDLVGAGHIAGLRVDHVDGLYDPKGYLERLQKEFVRVRLLRVLQEHPELGPEDAALAGLQASFDGKGDRQPCPVWVEKILGDNEPLRDDWLTQGTTGYEFVNMLNGLFVNPDQARSFTRLYQEWISNDDSFADVAYQQKFLILQVAMSSELHILAHQLDRLAQKNRWSRDFTLTTLRHVLREIIACFPVYRTYIAGDEVREADRKVVLTAVARAEAKNPALSTAAFRFVRDMLLLRYPENASDADREEQRRFAGKFQQVTAPVMAKGVEDTAFYVYDRLLSLNEVGGNPARFGVSPAALHQFLQERQARWPRALSTTSTHDTKRSEDVRARINVLSEMPNLWIENVRRWSELNQVHRTQIEEATVPDANEEYLLYQALLGSWPLEPYGPEDYAHYVDRVRACVMKALHEAKVHTSWINPNQAYDEAVQQFVARILDPVTGHAFLEAFAPFRRRIARLGLFNSLAQTLVKLTAPGIPDIYQGNELWDFSMVDPDNRRSVDYEQRRRLLAEVRERSANPRQRQALLADLTAHPEDGRIKLYVTLHALEARRRQPELFTLGPHVPLEATGSKKNHVFAFARRLRNLWAIVAVPRLIADLLGEQGTAPMGPVWEDTRLVLPAGGKWENVLTGESIASREEGGKPALSMARLTAGFPLVLLRGGDG